MAHFKKKLVEDFIKKVNPYDKPQSIAFDLRAYSKFISDNGLSAADITPEIMARFKIIPVK